MATDAYRGAGRPEAAYIIERVMDAVAAATNVDVIDVRRRNFISPDAFPYKTATGPTYDSGNYAANLDRALQLFDYENARRAQDDGPCRRETPWHRGGHLHRNLCLRLK